MVAQENFTETTTTLAAASQCLAETVRLYAKLGLIDSLVLPSGVRLFKPSAAEEVRRIYRQRLARRGGDHRRSAQAK